MSTEQNIQEIVPQLLDGLREFAALVERSKAVVEDATKAAVESAEPYMDKREAAAFLGYSVTTLERRMGMSDGPPRYVDGGKVSFLRSELRVWRRQWAAGDQTGLEETRGA